MPSISPRPNAAPKRETYVPRHKQLLLNPALAQQRPLHVDHAEEPAPNPGAAGPRPPIKKLAIGQPVLSFSSNPEFKLPKRTSSVVKPLKRKGVDPSPVSASGSESATHVAESSQVTSTQARTSVVQVKRKAVPIYAASEFSISNSTSTLSLSITAVSAAPRRHINDAESANLTGALDQRAVSAAPPSPINRRTSRDNHGLGLDWVSSCLLTDPESMPRTRASSTSSSSQRRSLKNSSPPLLPFPTATSTSTPQRSSIDWQAYHQTVSAHESAAKPITRAAFAGPAMDFVLGPDAYAHEDSPDARLQAWRKGMHDVEAEAERARTQFKRNFESQKHSTSSFFSFRRTSASSGSRASSSAGLSSSSHDTPSTNALSPVDSSFPALPFKDGSSLYGRSSVASSASSSRPFALVPGRSGSVASSRENGVGVAPRRASLMFGADDTRRKSTIASKARPTGVVGGEDSLLDVWVEMMGGEVEEASEELAQLPFPSRKRSSVSAGSDFFGRPPVPLRKASVVSQEPTYGAEAIMTLYHALPPLVYASAGRHGSQSESSSAPTLSSDDGLDSESDVSEDWRSACSQPATCEPTLAPSGNHADLIGFTWPTAKVGSRARFDVPEHLSPHSPHLSLASETAHATPTLPSTKSSSLSNALYHTSRSSSQQDFAANSRQSLAFESPITTRPCRVRRTP